MSTPTSKILFEQSVLVLKNKSRWKPLKRAVLQWSGMSGWQRGLEMPRIRLWVPAKGWKSEDWLCLAVSISTVPQDKWHNVMDSVASKIRIVRVIASWWRSQDEIGKYVKNIMYILKCYVMSAAVLCFNMKDVDEWEIKMHFIIHHTENENHERCYSKGVVCWSRSGRWIRQQGMGRRGISLEPTV